MKNTKWSKAYGQDEYGIWATLELSLNVSIRMRWIPAGEFTIGSPPQEAGYNKFLEAQDWVILTEGFWISETPITQEHWISVIGNNPSKFNYGPNWPVEQVSWDDCQRFCNILNSRFKGMKARLPSETQWEYACRAGTKSMFNDGSTCMEELGWYRENSDGHTHEVKQKKPNAWGLYDTHGNILEWCSNWLYSYGDFRWRPWLYGYKKNINKIPTWEFIKNPEGPIEGNCRAVRGGGYLSYAEGCRSAFRSGREPNYISSELGFRLCINGSMNFNFRVEIFSKIWKYIKLFLYNVCAIVYFILLKIFNPSKIFKL